MLTLPRNIPSSCLLRRGMLTIFLRLGIFQPAKWGIFNRRKLGNIQPALTPNGKNTWRVPMSSADRLRGKCGGRKDSLSPAAEG
jgi:hypothetical protein